MGHVDALKMVDHVRTRLVDLAVSENYFRDRRMSEAARKVWEGPGLDGGLVSELWVEGAFPGEHSPDCLDSLSDEGLFPGDLCQHLADRDVFPSDRRLYNHQSEAFRAAASSVSDSRTALVITAGTGLGKTEAFLLPMLRDLWTAQGRRPEGGMRCLILYPMNALVSDQVDRIYGWLQGQERLSVFHFTSETPEDARRANKAGVPKWERCRMRTRQEARGFETHDGEKNQTEPFGPVPDIVITNYSMLEYMLCRPQDYRFFGPDLRCIILDEAHLYTGALAAEITMLLRRVRQRCGVAASSILHLATSATLGGDDEDLLGFASTLFSTEQDSTRVIRGRTADLDLGEQESPPKSPAGSRDISAFADLSFNTLTANDTLVADDSNTVEKLKKASRLLVSEGAIARAIKEYPATPACFLHTALREAPLVRKVAIILGNNKSNVLSLDELAGRLFVGQPGEVERKASIALLRLAASARLRPVDMPLVPHRLHFLVRAPEGLSVCLNPDCSGPEERRVLSIGCLQPYGDRCRYCEHILLPVHRCDNCGNWALAAHENQENVLEPGYYAQSAEERTYYLLTQAQDSGFEEVVVNPERGYIRGHGAAGVSLWKAPRVAQEDKRQKCPTCQSVWGIAAEDEGQPEWRQTCQSLVGGRSFAMSVTAETVLHDLPALPKDSRNWKPAEGRRLLAFSDSRASAARLGPRLTQQHETQVVRAAMARCVSELVPADTATYLQEEVSRLESQIENASMQLRQHLERELEDKREKLKQAREGTPFVDFASLLSKRDELSQILDRETAERHSAGSYGQSDWKKNSDGIDRHVDGLIANELERPLKKRSTVESVGLIEIVYPGIDALSIPPTLEESLPSTLRAQIAGAWSGLVALLLDSVRRDSCVAWSEDKSSRTWLGESPLHSRWLTRTRGGWGASAFVGSTLRQLRRSFVADVLRTSGLDEAQVEQTSEQVLCAVFDQLFSMAGKTASGFAWLRKEEHHQTGHEESNKAIQILLDQLSMRAPVRLWKCDATGTIWTHSALGWAPIEGCQGTLMSTTPKELDKDPRWSRPRREFMESPIFGIGLWAEEHSAQLSPEENRRLQDLFKSGIRNILSSTTTMELGIDIGGLNGVLLGNVPPGPANHRQRAGRAGRRADGSAVVVTYSRATDYDREVFRRFGEFLQRKLRRPTVFLDRERIIRRHLHAILLSDFLRQRQPDKTGAMHAYGRMGSFCGYDSSPSLWRNRTKPPWRPSGVNVASQFQQFLEQIQAGETDLQECLASIAAGTALEWKSRSEKWSGFIKDASKILQRAIEEWTNEIKQLRGAWEEIPSEPHSDVGREMAKANSIRYMIKTLCDMTVIEWLADRRFLPRYGFPINLQKLTVRKAIEGDRRGRSEPNERYRLERSSLLALSEYVPESRVLVGGRVATSRGIRKHWTDSNLDQALGLQYFALTCTEEHVYLGQSPEDACPSCGGTPARKQRLVFPRFGYTTAGWETTPIETNTERIGEQTVCPIAFTEHGKGEVCEDFADVTGARLIYREEAPLLVRNSGRMNSRRQHCGFAICTRCGFAMSEVNYGEGRMDLPRGFENHASVFSSNPRGFCWGKGETVAPVLRNRILAARELTDMLLLEWPGATVDRDSAVYTFGRALVLAGARMLELDERELGMELMPVRNSQLGIAIYDTAPGGAGHCQELIKLGQEWIKTSRDILFVNKEHNARCEKACLDCILDFSAQYSASRLDRRAAIDLLDNAIT